MDTHKKEHRVAVLYPQTGELQEFAVKNTVQDITKMVKRIHKHSGGKVRFCYEAGVCGFVLKRRIESLGAACAVIAPSLVPTKPGERIKTDRRDAKKLLGQFVAGQLTEVYAPDRQQEAARELTRLRQTAHENLKRIRHQVVKLLTRHGYLYSQGRHWTARHLAWLRSLEFDLPDLREVFESYFTELQHCLQRLAALDKQVEQLAQREPYRELVGLLRCFRGIDTLTAITVLTELFAWGRFASPAALMAYLGLVPSEYSSGPSRRPGAITKTGNERVRRLLVESGWHYRHRPWVSRELKRRRQGQPQWAINLADRAMLRLYQRYERLLERGKVPNQAVVAVARELTGFLWAVLREYQLRRMHQVA
jgi:transposase